MISNLRSTALSLPGQVEAGPDAKLAGGGGGGGLRGTGVGGRHARRPVAGGRAFAAAAARGPGGKLAEPLVGERPLPPQSPDIPLPPECEPPRGPPGQCCRRQPSDHSLFSGQLSRQSSLGQEQLDIIGGKLCVSESSLESEVDVYFAALVGTFVRLREQDRLSLHRSKEASSVRRQAEVPARCSDKNDRFAEEWAKIVDEHIQSAADAPPRARGPRQSRREEPPPPPPASGGSGAAAGAHPAPSGEAAAATTLAAAGQEPQPPAARRGPSEPSPPPFSQKEQRQILFQYHRELDESEASGIAGPRQGGRRATEHIRQAQQLPQVQLVPLAPAAKPQP